MKKILCCLLICALLCFVTVPAFAAPDSSSKIFQNLKPESTAAFLLESRYTVVGGSTHIYIESATWSPASSLYIELFPCDIPRSDTELSKKIYHTEPITGGSASEKDFLIPQEYNGDYMIFLRCSGPESYGPVNGAIQYSISQ